MNERFFLDNLWRDMAGMKEININPGGPGYLSLRHSEWSSEFEALMRNRLIVGAMRYGLLFDKSKPKYDRIDSIIKRAQEYQKTGNDELLVDIANLCLLEFEEGEHEAKHFKSIDDGSHVSPMV